MCLEFRRVLFRSRDAQELGADVGPRSHRLLAVRRALGRPQLIGSDRHITQGGVCIESMEWDEHAETLSGVVKLVGGNATKLTLFVPMQYDLDKVEADGATVMSSSLHTDGTATLTLLRETSGSSTFRFHLPLA